MPWVTLVMILISGFVTHKLIGLSRKKDQLKFLGLTIAVGIFLLMEGAILTEALVADPAFSSVAAFIVEWGHVTCLAFILSSYAIFIRDSKPVFAQFPKLYTGLPLLIVISYLLVYDTYALKTLLIAIYQGGAIIVSLLMYSVYTYRDSDYAMILSGVIIFLMSYLLFWYVPGIQEAYQWVWKFLLAAGMVTTVLGFDRVDSVIAPNTVDG